MKETGQGVWLQGGPGCRRRCTDALFTCGYLGVGMECIRDGKGGSEAGMSTETLECLSDEFGTAILYKTKYRVRVWI